MRPGRWFLPETPDVIGLLRRQLAVTIDGADALAAWARSGSAGDGDAVAAAEARGDEVKRELLQALRAALVSPLEPEDAFALSRGLDRVLEQARDLVGESGAMRTPPDPRIAEIASLAGESLRELDRAIARIGSDSDAAIAAADAALTAERRLRQSYYDGMAELLEVQIERERISRRELYRRCASLGETLVEVAERVVYAIVKES